MNEPYTETRKRIGFGAILAGLFLFFNPYFAVFDVLPDWIGSLILFLALAKFAHIDRRMAQARDAFLKLLVFYLCRDAGVLIVFGMCTEAERPTALLALGFVGAALGLYFAFSAFSELFEGFYSLAVKYEASSLYGTCKTGNSGKEFCRTELALRATRIFLVIREVFGVLPEFSSLTLSDYTDSGLIRIYDHIGVMRAMAFIVVLFAGVIWYISICRFFANAKEQQDFLTELGRAEERYRQTHPGNAITRRYTKVFILLSIGAFLLADFYLDFQNILPDPLAAVFLLAGVLITDLSHREKLACTAACALYGVVSVFSARYTLAFVQNYIGAQISKNAEAADAYFTMWIWSLVEMLVFLLLLAALLLALRKIISKWAGYVAEYADTAFEQRRRRAFLADFDAKLIRTFGIGFLSALASFLYDYVKEIPNKGIFHVMEFFWAVDLLLAVFFAVSFAALLGSIRSQIKNRFALEED